MLIGQISVSRRKFDQQIFINNQRLRRRLAGKKTRVFIPRQRIV